MLSAKFSNIVVHRTLRRLLTIDDSVGRIKCEIGQCPSFRVAMDVRYSHPRM